MNVIVIVQARMGSTRLPGKIMKQVLGKTLLEYLLERLQRVKRCDAICVATTMKLQEQPILDTCYKMSVKTFRGSEEDVLERYFLAARELKADAVVRVTSDCPLIDPAEVDKLIGYYLANKDNYDFVADVPGRSYPWGMSAEIFSFETLEVAHKNALSHSQREHVTPFIRMNPQMFRSGHVAYEEDQRDHRWTVDTLEDFQLVSKIIERLYPGKPDFTIKDILRLLEENSQWKNINNHVLQKTIGK